MSFEDRCEEMGLENKDDVSFYYTDIYGEVVYKRIITKGDSGIVDDVDIPGLALFVKADEDDDFSYRGTLSEMYKFVGNNVINEQLRNSIREHGSPILTENTYFNTGKTQMFNEIIIQNLTNVPQAGDIYPTLTVKNSYDGTMSCKISFGLSIQSDYGSLGFSFKIGEMKQIHLQSADTSLQTSVSNYINSFSVNIVELIESSFNNRLTEDSVMKTLDLIESFGKKKRKEISASLANIIRSREDENPTVSAFDMFLAITKYSTIEKNLNAKTMLENIAESVLVVPAQMMGLIDE